VLSDSRSRTALPWAGPAKGGVHQKRACDPSLYREGGRPQLPFAAEHALPLAATRKSYRSSRSVRRNIGPTCHRLMVSAVSSPHCRVPSSSASTSIMKSGGISFFSKSMRAPDFAGGLSVADADPARALFVLTITECRNEGNVSGA